MEDNFYYSLFVPGTIAQLVAHLTAETGCKFGSQLGLLTFIEIDHEIISSFNPPFTDSRRAVVIYCTVLDDCLEDYACPRKSVSRLNDWLDMTITVLTGL